MKLQKKFNSNSKSSINTNVPIYSYANEPQRPKTDIRPAKIQIRLRVRIRAVGPESSLGTFWIAKDAKFLNADREDSDYIARNRRLI